MDALSINMRSKVSITILLYMQIYAEFDANSEPKQNKIQVNTGGEYRYCYLDTRYNSVAYQTPQDPVTYMNLSRKIIWSITIIMSSTTIFITPRACARGKATICISVIVGSGTKIVSLDDLSTWATHRRMDPSELLKNWPQYALNHLTQATSATNSACLPRPVDVTYLMGHVLSAHAR